MTDGLNRGGQIAEGRDDDDRHVAYGLAEVVHRLKAAHAGQAHVKHNDVGTADGSRLQTLLGRCGGRRAVTERLGQFGQSPTNARFVVDDQ